MSQEVGEDLAKIEDTLKKLMQNMFEYLQKFIDKNEDNTYMEEHFLKEYDDLAMFTDIIVKFFDFFTQKVDEKIKKIKKNAQDNDDNFSITDNEDYKKLEEILQKHEAENRTYLRTQLQMKLMIDGFKQKQEDLEKEKQEVINSTKANLQVIYLIFLKNEISNIFFQQKNKEIQYLHIEIAKLKKQIEDQIEINSNQEFSIKEYETQLNDYKQKCKILQQKINEQNQIGSSQNILPKKDGSFKTMGISLNLKKSLNNEIKHSSDPDLNKHALNSNSSSRNKHQLNASSISTLCTNTNQKLGTPNKNERGKSTGIGFIQNNLLSVSSRGGNPVINNIYQSQYSSGNGATGAYLGGISSTNTQSLNSHPMQEIQDQINLQQASSAQKTFQEYSIKQQLIKQIKDVNKESLNKSNQKEQKVNSHNTSQHMDSKDLVAYLSSGPIQSIQNSNNNSFIGMSASLKPHKRSKSQQGGKMKGGPLVNNQNLNSAGRANSSLNQRNRNLNSSTYHHNTSAADYSSLINILNKDQYLDMNISSLNPTVVVNPNNNSFNKISNKVTAVSNSQNQSSNISNNNVSNSTLSQQMMMQLYSQGNHTGSATRHVYSSSGKRPQSRQNK
ncbi:hypothetical protein ABPG74_010484 [Tetrahymena malaccensis]